MPQIFESLRMRVENENESSHNKIESRDWEWDESFPWESQFWDRDESLAEVCHRSLILASEWCNITSIIQHAYLGSKIEHEMVECLVASFM